MALSKSKLIKRNIYKGFGTVQVKRLTHLNEVAYFESRSYDQQFLSSKHYGDDGSLHRLYAQLRNEAIDKYNKLMAQWANGTESKYALNRY